MPGHEEVGVRVEGLNELRRDLRRIDPELAKILRADLKRIADTVAAEARTQAPVLTGKYAASIKAYAAGSGVSIGSRLPYAGVLHYGGTIQPRGVDITFAPRPVISDAVDRATPKILDEVGEAVEQAAHRAGWK